MPLKVQLISFSKKLIGFRLAGIKIKSESWIGIENQPDSIFIFFIGESPQQQLVAICSARASNACSAVMTPDACHPVASLDLNSKSGGGGGALGGAWNSELAKKRISRHPNLLEKPSNFDSPESYEITFTYACTVHMLASHLHDDYLLQYLDYLLNKPCFPFYFVSEKILYSCVKDNKRVTNTLKDKYFKNSNTKFSLYNA